MTRRTWLALAGGLAAGLPVLSRSADPGAKRVGVLGIAGGGTYTYWKEEFANEFRKHGFIDGRNLQLAWFDVPESPDFARMREASRRRAAEMAAASLDCMVANGDAHSRLLQEASKTVPIVVVVPDPVSLGFARTVARPGGNVTGLHEGHDDVAVKTAELFRKLIPGIGCMGWIGSENFKRTGNALEATTRSLGLRFRAVEIRSDREEEEPRIARELAAMKRDGCVAVQALWAPHMDAIARHALANQIAVSGFAITTEGFLFSYSAGSSREQDSARRVPAIVARVLRGEKPGEIPFEGPIHYKLAVNLKTAARLGIAVPPDVLIQADRVIR